MGLTKCEGVGVKAVALTFDAQTTNISTIELLGCEIKDSENFKATFKHPAADCNVAVFLDLSHMIKLVRNHFEDTRESLDLEERKVNWGYLIKLNDKQDKGGLHLANKLIRRHLEFKNSVMKEANSTSVLPSPFSCK